MEWTGGVVASIGNALLGSPLSVPTPNSRLGHLGLRVGKDVSTSGHVMPPMVLLMVGPTLELSCEAPKFAGLRQLQLLVRQPHVPGAAAHS